MDAVAGSRLKRHEPTHQRERRLEIEFSTEPLDAEVLADDLLAVRQQLDLTDDDPLRRHADQRRDVLLKLWNRGERDELVDAIKQGVERGRFEPAREVVPGAKLGSHRLTGGHEPRLRLHELLQATVATHGFVWGRRR